jgi:CDP-paratose 2-epimerase
MRVLITGGCGFVGSSIAIYMARTYPSYKIVAFDNLHRRGSELNLKRLGEFGIQFVHGDIRNQSDLRTAGHADVVIEASAEPSVMAGIDSSPDYTIDTNLLGTIHALNYAKLCKASFVFLSTSRVYPINQIEKIKIKEAKSRFEIDSVQEIEGVTSEGISEQFPLEGYRSIYGATKLASEIMIQEYNHFYDMNTVINRCGVLTGPWQMGKVDQGFVVLWLARHFWKQQLSYIGFGGSGKQVRDILHVADLCRLIDIQIHTINSFSGKLYNVGGGTANSASLYEMTVLCQKITGNSIVLNKVEENRQADIAIYVTDNSKIGAACGWKPEIQLAQIVEEIHEWIKENQIILQPILR